MKLVIADTYYNRFKDQIDAIIPDKNNLIIDPEEKFIKAHMNELYFFLTDAQEQAIMEKGLL